MTSHQPASAAGMKAAGVEAATAEDAGTVTAEAARLRAAGDRNGLLDLATRHPGHPGVAYQTAWLHDTLGLEAEAVPFYVSALAVPGLDPADRLGASTGLGSTYRVLGRYDDALATFDRALSEHPGDPGLIAFRAMTLHNLGRSGEAVRDLLQLLARTADAPAVARYRRAIEFYAERLDETVHP